MRKTTLLLIAGLICFSPNLRAQLWSGIISPNRATDWSTAGVSGGIPNRTTICTTLNPGATAAQINTAISNCSSAHANDGGGVVLLNAGTYSLSTAIQMKSNVTLRGAGANQTILNFTGSYTYYWGAVNVLFQGNYAGTWDSSPPGLGGANPSNNKAWIGTNGVTGVYTQGATVLNLGSAPTGSPNLQVGDTLQLYQNDDSGPTSGPFVCGSGSGCSREGSGYTQGTGQQQFVKVVAISGSQVTVWPGIYVDTWSASKSPRAYWWGGDIRKAGIEDLRINASPKLWSVVEFYQASDSWISGVAIHTGTKVGTRTGIRTLQTRNITIQNNFLDPEAGGGWGSTTSYGIETMVSSGTLIMNNIAQGVESPFLYSTATAGSVTAYNYDAGAVPPTIYDTGLASHEEGYMMNLYEGNVVARIRADNFHGSQNFGTIFRNRVWGDDEAAIDLWSYARYFNIIGNVLGNVSPQASKNYECFNNFSSSQCDRYTSSTNANIYRGGYPGPGHTTSDGGVAADAQVKATLYRWGNWDTVTNATRWCGNSSNTGWSTICSSTSEVPTGLSSYAQKVPSSESLPPSLFLNSKPAWWPSNKPWPAIGPDVTGGNMPGVAGRAYTIPAQDCYNSISGDMSKFSAKVCYGGSTGSTGPNPATNLRTVVR